MAKQHGDNPKATDKTEKGNHPFVWEESVYYYQRSRGLPPCIMYLDLPFGTTCWQNKTSRRKTRRHGEHIQKTAASLVEL